MSVPVPLRADFEAAQPRGLARKIDQPPCAPRRGQPGSDGFRSSAQMAWPFIELRGLAWRFAVKQAGGAPRIEPRHQSGMSPTPPTFAASVRRTARASSRRAARRPWSGAMDILGVPHRQCQTDP
jgi:hypothetical protein